MCRHRFVFVMLPSFVSQVWALHQAYAVDGLLMERLELCHLLYIRSRRPKRIILMRHAESEGNVDKEIYTSIPDHALKITDRGRKQASCFP